MIRYTHIHPYTFPGVKTVTTVTTLVRVGLYAFLQRVTKVGCNRPETCSNPYREKGCNAVTVRFSQIVTISPKSWPTPAKKQF